jgi:tRNA(fMet)-specific endonuclease VapC
MIRAERRGLSVEKMIADAIDLVGDQNVALTSIGLTEFVHGIYRAPNEEIRLRRREFLNEVLRDLTVHPYTTETSLLAGQIDGEQTAKGITIPFTDLLIGATALSLGFGVLTANVRHFQMIPGLTVVSL